MNDQMPPSLERFAGELEQGIRRELTRRDARLRRVLRARPRLLAGTTVGAASAAAVLALVLSTVGSSPAFAVTRNHNGTYTVTLKSLNAIPAANKRLAQMHARSVIVDSGGRLSCSNSLPGPVGGKAVSVVAPGNGNGSGNGSLASSGMSGNSLRAASVTTIVCPGSPPSGSGKSGNSGNSGNG